MRGQGEGRGEGGWVRFKAKEDSIGALLNSVACAVTEGMKAGGCGGRR